MLQTLPADLVHNSKLQNLDLGNNVITGWSDLKVRHADLEFLLSLTFHDCLENTYTFYLGFVLQLQVLKSLMNLRNLNLQGNPVATNDKIARKVFLPFLYCSLVNFHFV